MFEHATHMHTCTDTYSYPYTRKQERKKERGGKEAYVCNENYQAAEKTPPFIPRLVVLSLLLFFKTPPHLYVDSNSYYHLILPTAMSDIMIRIGASSPQLSLCYLWRRLYHCLQAMTLWKPLASSQINEPRKGSFASICYYAMPSAK